MFKQHEERFNVLGLGLRYSLQTWSLNNYKYWRFVTHIMWPKYQNNAYLRIFRNGVEASRMQTVGPWRFEPATYYSISLNVNTGLFGFILHRF